MPMSDEQVQALMQNWRDALAKQMDEMRVRQWCVEQAIKALAKNGEVEVFVGDRELGAQGEDDTLKVRFAVVWLSYEFLRFITAPFASTFKDHPPSCPDPE